MRSRTLLFSLTSVGSLLLLPLAVHAAIPFFGPIVPLAYNSCAAGWGMLITVINNLISFLLTLAIVFVAPLSIAYAGFLFVVNPVNASGKEKAKGILLNTVVGIVIAMAGWMIVDAVMAVLYDSKAVGGTWWSLVGTGGLPPCITLPGSLTSATGQVPATGVSATGSLKSPPSGKAGTACDPAVVQAAAARGGYDLSATQANIFACIAQPESQCGAPQNPPNYNWNSAKSSPGSSAAGAFQVLLQGHSDCYENKTCTDAVGLSSGTKLNCASGFSGGNPIPTKSGVVDQCVKAANNLDCSTSAAACVLKQSGGNFKDWQADVKSAQQTGCITSGT